MTPRQAELLGHLKALTTAEGVAPSYEELRLAMGLSAKSGVSRLVAGLADQGLVTMPGGKARRLCVTGAGPAGGGVDLGVLAGAVAGEIERAWLDDGHILDRQGVLDVMRRAWPQVETGAETGAEARP